MGTKEARRFGKVLREIRISKGLTQEAVEHEIGAYTGYISRVEAGQKNISITTLLRIAHALGASIYFGDKELTTHRK